MAILYGKHKTKVMERWCMGPFHSNRFAFLTAPGISLIFNVYFQDLTSLRRNLASVIVIPLWRGFYGFCFLPLLPRTSIYIYFNKRGVKICIKQWRCRLHRHALNGSLTVSLSALANLIILAFIQDILPILQALRQIRKHSRSDITH